MPLEDLTPEQVEQINTYGNALLAQPDMTNVRHPLQALAVMFNALSGRQHVNLAEKYRAGQRAEYTNRNIVPRPNFNPVTTGSVGPSDTTQQPPVFGPNNTELRNPEGRLMRTVTAGRSGARFDVADEYADRFQTLLDRLEAAGYEIHPDQSSGFSYRNIAGTNRRSMHADGNAIDINSRLNARGRRGNIDPALARSLAAELGFRWGGDFGLRNGRQNPLAMDDMHFEIDPNFRPQSRPFGVPGGMTASGAAPNDGRMNLGMGAQAAEGLRDQAGEQNLVQQVQDAPENSPNIGTLSRTRPQGAPERVAPNHNISRLERLLQMGANLNPQQVEQITKEYQQAIQPVQVETAGGTSHYDPFSGEFMYFAPKLQTPSLGIGNLNVPDPFIVSPGGGGAEAVPRQGGGASAPQSVQPPPANNSSVAPPAANTPPAANNQSSTGPISPRLPPYIRDILARPSPSTTMNLPGFPESRNVGDLANFESQYTAQRANVNRASEEGSRLVEAARQRAANAGRALESLNTIRAAALSAPNIPRGQGLSDFIQRYAVYFRNLGINLPVGTPQSEIINKLNADLASKVVEDITARGTNFQLETFIRNFPSLTQSFEGSLALMDYLQQVQRQHQELGAIAGEISANPGQVARWNEIETAYHDRNPVYLNIPNAQGQTMFRMYTGRLNNAAEAANRVQPGERFIDPQGRILMMTREFKQKYGTPNAQ